jgi:hypothetical protein
MILLRKPWIRSRGSGRAKIPEGVRFAAAVIAHC